MAFFGSAVDVLKVLVIALGAGLGIVLFYRRTDSVHHRLQYLLCLSISVVAARPSCGNRLGGLCSIVSLCCISGDWRKHKGKSS